MVAAIWAATALAGGNSASASSDRSSDDPFAEFVQAEEDAVPPAGEDCPEDGAEDGADGGSGDSSGSDGSSSTDF